MKNKELQFYVYTLDGESLGEHPLSSFAVLLGKSETIIAKAVRKCLRASDKGYGYYGGYFISTLPVDILSKEESIKFSEKVLSLNYERIKRSAYRLFGNDNDVLSATDEYILKAIRSDRGVNNVEDTFLFKYKMNKIDKRRRYQTRTGGNEIDCSEDCHIIALEWAGEVDYENAEVIDVPYSYVDDINDDLLYNCLIEAIVENFSKEWAVIWYHYRSEFKGVIRDDWGGGISGVARKFGITRNKADRIVKEVEAYVEEYKEEIYSIYETQKYYDDENYEHFSLF